MDGTSQHNSPLFYSPPSLPAVSDIPDWTYTEAWGTEEAKKRAGARPSADDIARFYQVSPISHVDQVGAWAVYGWVGGNWGRGRSCVA